MAEPEKDTKDAKPEKEKKTGFFNLAAKKATADVSKDVGEKIIGEVGKQ
uniref:Uncharacterized protein n=1 Tax=Plectus sambesii TaxID=2011161 RepID=A0A914UYB6_9BILA